MRNSLAGGLSACLVVVASIGCGAGGVTSSKIENALAPTFANLIHLQENMLGLGPVDAASLRASAICHKLDPGKGDSGAGNWKCTVTWFASTQRSPLRDSYDLSVTPDGCYTATVDDAHLGGPTLPTKGGGTVVNLLYVFDGCFDAT
jgi:hypothetical protein